jgi:phosphoenolpyruvate carboxylase
VSFTASAGNIRDVLELAARSGDPALPSAATAGFPPASPALDVVPLFESADALTSCAEILETLFADPTYRAHLATRGSRQEVMLGYSDSNKESGFLAANWMLHRAQAAIVEVARRQGIDLTIFHGRGGAIGRGGGPTNRAIRALAPGSLGGRLKVTEQGEVIAAHYADPAIARRELEQMVNGVLMASVSENDTRIIEVATAGAPVMDELAERARVAYRALVWDEPEFAAFFQDATPIAELSALRLGSRPAARGRVGRQGGDGDGDMTPRSAEGPPRLADLRAIPWVFAWSQARLELPGWYGLGAALDGYRVAHGERALDELGPLYRQWPFFASVLDNAESILARVDLAVAHRYAQLARGAEAARFWATIEDEYRRSVALLLRIAGRERLLDATPALQRSLELRNPYVDSLSDLQVRLLARSRALEPDDPERGRLLRLVQLTVNGVAAGLRNTG